MYVPHPDSDTRSPRYLTLADAIVRDIRAGRLQPGDRLPGTRQLARVVGLHRNTVVRAYAELTHQGWTDARVGSGTRIAQSLPTELPKPEGERQKRRAGFRLPARPPLPDRNEGPKRRFPFLAGQPDLRHLPIPAFTRAIRRAMKRRGVQLADYGDPQGSRRLREALSRWLAARRSLSVAPENLLSTRGAQQALYLAAHTLFEPGDTVAVEAYGYPPAWHALRTAGVRCVPIPVDADGLIVEALREQPDLRGVYVTPHHQYPTGAMLSAPRREALLALAGQRRFVILEDDYDHEFHWHGHPVAPLASLDRHGVVVYIGTLSKAFAPGVRMGWVAGPGEAITRMTRLRRYVDRQGDQVVEHAMAELMEDGELDRHIRRMHRLYRERREVVLERLPLDLPDLEPNDPPGGLGIWCRAPSIDVEALKSAAGDADVGFLTAREVRFDGVAERAFRLGFPALTPDELREGLTRIRTVLAGQRDSFGVGAHTSRALPGTSSDPVLLETAEGRFVQKTLKGRALQQAVEALRRVDPDRIEAVQTGRLLLRWVEGAAGSDDPRVHAAAGQWLRGFQEVDSSDAMPLDEAFERRIDATLRGARTLGLQVAVDALEGLDPRSFAGQRVWCHRDFRPDNWVWDGTRLQVIDFEHARPDHPLVDVVKLATEVWPDRPDLEAAFRSTYEADATIDEAVLDGLIALHGATTLVWGVRHADPHFEALGASVLDQRSRRASQGRRESEPSQS